MTVKVIAMKGTKVVFISFAFQFLKQHEITVPSIPFSNKGRFIS